MTIGQQVPLRIDRVQQGILELVRASVPATTNVAWAYGQQSLEVNGEEWISLRVVSGPTPQLRRAARARLISVPSSVTLTVVSVAPRVGVRINGHLLFVDGAASEADAAAGLIAAINDDWTLAGGDPCYVAAAGGTPEEIEITPAFNGAIWSLSVLNSALELTAAPESPTCVHLTQGNQIMTVGVDCFSKQRAPRLGAWNLAQRALAGFQTRVLAEQLTLAGCGVQTVGPLVDLSAVQDQAWESRTTFDVDVAALASWVVDADTIDTLKLSLTVSGNTVEIDTN